MNAVELYQVRAILVVAGAVMLIDAIASFVGCAFQQDNPNAAILVTLMVLNGVLATICFIFALSVIVGVG